MGTQASADLPLKPDARAAGTRLLPRPVDGSVMLALMHVAPRAARVNFYPPWEQAPLVARRDTQAFLSGYPSLPAESGEAALLIVSELVTNAYEHSTHPGTHVAFIALSLRLFSDRLLIEVIDSSPRPPVLRPAADTEAESGRGLAVVDALSRDWGYFFGTDQKVVYAACPIPPPTTGSRG